MERHEAIVAGAGPAGLAAAALLRKHGFETVVLERSDGVGDRWRNRYEGLRLNTIRLLSTLPGYRVPRRYGRYPRREDYVTYLEDYAAHHSLSLRFDTELQRVDRAEEDGLWELQTSKGPLLARYAVVATGYDAIPKLPDWAQAAGFGGELIHSSEYRAPGPYRGKRVLIVGAGNTGIDIAGFLIDAGAEVSMSMRTPPNVYPRDLLGFPLQLSALPNEYMPSRIGDVFGDAMQRVIYGDLSKYGLPRSPEGYLTKFRTRRIGPAVDDGFIAALKEGRTRIVAPVERLDGDEVVLTDGARLKPDAVICATGYERGLEPIVGHLGVLEPDGLPKNHDAAPEHHAAPRLYFTGFYGAPAGQIRLFPIHARRIARAAARDRGAGA